MRQPYFRILLDVHGRALAGGRLMVHPSRGHVAA
jgi:hypothetical protein